MSVETPDYWKYWIECISYLEKDSSENAISYAKNIAEKLNVPQSLINRIFEVNLSSYSAKIDSYMEQCI